MKKLSHKLASVAAVALTVAPSTVGIVNTVVNSPIVYAEDTAENKQIAVTAKAAIEDAVAKGKSGNVFAQSYSVNLTVPDAVKAGSTVSLTVENLPLLFGSGSVSSADVKVEDTVIGKITLKKSVNQRNQQISTKTNLDQKKAEKITAGGGLYEYELVFNEKASEFKNKEVSFKSSSEGNVFTATAKDVTVKSKVSVNGQEVASKDLTIKPTPKQDIKEKSSTVDLSTNTQLTQNSDGTVKYFLGLGIRPLDQDYGVGSKITVTLPKDSMMAFEKEGNESKEISIIPAFNSESFVNDAGVYLADVNPVKVAVSEVTKDKVVFEVKEGTLKRVQYYVINSENTPISFRLTDKAAGKLSADGKTFGPETITSSITTPEGKVNNTDVNSSSIRVNGAAMTAKGVQELINKPTQPAQKQEFTTRWIRKDGDKEIKLKDDVKGDKIMDPDKFDGYVLKETKQEEKVTTYIYEKVATKTTSWVEEVITKDDSGKEVKSENTLKDSVTGEKTEEAGEIEGFTFVRTDKDDNGNVKHVFKKVDPTKVTTTWVEEIVTKKDGKEVKSEKELKKPTVTEKAGDPGTFEGYTFVRTDVDKAGNTKHVFKKIAEATTKTPDKKNPVNTGAAAGALILPGIAVVSGGVGLGVKYFAKRKAGKK